MTNGNISLRYYLFSISNLLAAFGGGLVLGKGLGIINIPYLKNGSILAFFIGTIFGLIFLQFIPKKLSKLLSQSFSICCAITSVILFYIFENYSIDGEISGNIGLIFFSLLSIRFGFWFYSRVIRASNAAGQQQSIAWVELGYYSGMILGLIIWKLFKINIELSTALVIDAVFQFIAGVLDFKGNSIHVPTLKLDETIAETQKSSFNTNYYWLWKLSSAVILLTVGVQVVIFNLSHQVAESLGVYVLAIFYFGVASAAFIANKFKILIIWDSNIANITFKNKNKMSLLVMASVSATFVLMSIILVDSNTFVYILGNLYFKQALICLFVYISSFAYEIISLALLERIGYEEKNLQGSNMIMKTYGLMGLGAAIGLWLLGISTNSFQSCIILVALCFSCSIFLVFKRTNASNDVFEQVIT